MPRMVPRLPALALALVFTITAADAAQRRAKPEPPPPPPQFKVDGPTRPMAMERIALTVPSGTALGEIIIHPFCITNSYPLTMNDAFGGAKTDSFIDAFMQEADAAGYALAGRQNSADLFTPGGQQRPELIVGGAIVAAKQNGCGQNIFGMINITIDSSVTVDWQVFDPLEKKLLFRATKEGTTKLKKQLAADTIPTEAALAAFRESAKALLSDSGFVAALRLPASNGAGGSTTPAPQPQSAPDLVIPRVPLRTLAFKDQIPELRHQVVTIFTGDSMGSGFYVADGLVMTNNHVIEGHKAVKIRFFGGREISGDVVAANAQRDVALIRAPGGGMLGLPVQFDRPQVGSTVYVIGSPQVQQLEGTVTSGIVSAYRVEDGRPILQSDVAVTHGNSGGPMFDDKGNVVALVVAGLEPEGSQIGLNFFIPVDDAFRVLGVGVDGHSLSPAAANLASAGGRRIQVSMYPASGPLQKTGKTQPITGNVGGVGTSGTFTFTRPDGVNCDGKWTTLQSKPASGSLLDKHRDVVGISANPEGMVGGLAIGACSNGGSFQAEYYVVPNIDSGFGAATDSDGNIYKVIF
ncbi:MAG: S1C family serine protease [Rhodospirillaceae bacterium]